MSSLKKLEQEIRNWSILSAQQVNVQMLHPRKQHNMAFQQDRLKVTCKSHNEI